MNVKDGLLLLGAVGVYTLTVYHIGRKNGYKCGKFEGVVTTIQHMLELGSTSTVKTEDGINKEA